MSNAKKFIQTNTQSKRKQLKSKTGYGGTSRVYHIDQQFDIIDGKSLDVMHAMLLNAYKTTICLCLQKLSSADVKKITETTKHIQRQGELKSEISNKLTGNATILDIFKGSPKGIITSYYYYYRQNK